MGRCCPDNCPGQCNPYPPLRTAPSQAPKRLSETKPSLKKPQETPKSRIRILNIDPMLSVNGPQHHTNHFAQMKTKEKPQLVVRRGQPFLLKFKLDRDYTPEYDAISLIFLLEGTEPKFGTGTEVIFPVFVKAESDDLLVDLWYGIVESATDNYMIVKIQASTNCIVGEWKLEIDTKFKSTNEGGSYIYKDNITILFNAWNSSDQVYMENDQSRIAYVLNETGVLVTNESCSIPWFFGQFQRNILKIAIHLLSVVHPTRHETRQDAVSVARALSGALNSNKNEGVLVAKWGDDYSDGINPNSWVGSVNILQEYHKSKLPVKYGQCSVFAAVCTTVCRAVGIPARPVTVLDCAHDSDGNFLIDFNIDAESKSDEDSIWDYHVMTEVWMKRLDVADDGEYDGWNVLDCTPQSRVGNNFLCGPAAIRAIKHGEVQKPFDVDYLYSCVNADLAYWKTGVSPTKLVSVDTNRVGSCVLTQDHENADGIIDITENYKFPEGSNEERIYFEKIMKQSHNEIFRYSYNPRALLRLCMTLPDQPMIGSSFDVVVKMCNLTNQSHTVGYTITLFSRDYTGHVEQVVKREKLHIDITTTHVHLMRIDYDDYKSCLHPSHNSFSVHCSARIDEFDYDYFCSDRFTLRRPTLVVNAPREVRESEEFTIMAHFGNPLPTPLTKGEFLFEGTDNHEIVKLTTNVTAKGKASGNCKWKVKTSGEAAVMASFVCQEFSGIYGYTKFSVYSKT